MRIVTFYSFFEVSNLIFLENKIKEFSKKIEIKGNILLGPEGVNGTIAVSNHSKAITKSFLINLGVDEKNIKISEFNGKRIFNGFKIKKKKEIVTSDFELTANDMSQGQFIEPQVWDNFIQQEDVFIIDTRNEYEFRLGHFEKAIDPCINTFREFKGYIEDNKEKLKKKKVAIYCTGGIRCEKAGPLMQKHGIDTYQLKGGILEYLQVSKAKKWNGECFVFDYRVAVDKKLKPGKAILCHGCNKPLSPDDTKSKFYRDGYSCHRCYKFLSSKKIRSLMDKRKFWKRVLEA